MTVSWESIGAGLPTHRRVELMLQRYGYQIGAQGGEAQGISMILLPCAGITILLPRPRRRPRWLFGFIPVAQMPLVVATLTVMDAFNWSRGEMLIGVHGEEYRAAMEDLAAIFRKELSARVVVRLECSIAEPARKPRRQ